MSDEQCEAAEFIAAMSAELSRIALKHGFSTADHLLKMVAADMARHLQDSHSTIDGRDRGALS